MQPHTADHIAHYRIDAEQFDYFEPQTGPDADATQRIRDGVVHAARIPTGALVLDAGSGSGWLGRTVPHARIVSVDLGLRNLQRIRETDPAARAVCADLTRLPFRDEAFARIVASEVIEHVPDPAAFVREAARCLSRGGRLTVSTPYKERLRYSLCIHCNRPTPANAHLHSFDETRHRTIAQAAGLQDVRMTPIQNKLFIASRLSWLLRSLPYRLWRIVDRFCMFALMKANTIIVTSIRP
jgi:SAM-dependent methyltransferase